jgi:hypothetical protein
MPDDTFEALKVVSGAPEPEKSDAVMLVADLVVPDERPVNVQPVKGKTNDNIEDKRKPLQYISAQFILVNTSKA